MLSEGTVLQGRYVIGKVLGQGGMGAVYLARQDNLGGRPVAIKETIFQVQDPAQQAQIFAQFHREAKTLASIEHPNLVDVRDFFEENGSCYMVMAFVDGQTLHDLLSESQTFLPIPQVLGWMDQLCDVLEMLHRHDPPVIVRDLKPGNVMLDRSGRIRLIDFGIARLDDQGFKTATFLKGAGTLGFAPIEQFGGGHTDARADIYGLGATIYMLLTSTLPPWSMHLATGEERLVPPSQINPDIPPSLEAVILKMMSLRRDERYQSAAEARAALKAAAGEVRASTTPRVHIVPSFCEQCGSTLMAGGQACPRCGPLPRIDSGVPSGSGSTPSAWSGHNSGGSGAWPAPTPPAAPNSGGSGAWPAPTPPAAPNSGGSGGWPAPTPPAAPNSGGSGGWPAPTPPAAPNSGGSGGWPAQTPPAAPNSGGSGGWPAQTPPAPPNGGGSSGWPVATPPPGPSSGAAGGWPVPPASGSNGGASGWAPTPGPTAAPWPPSGPGAGPPWSAHPEGQGHGEGRRAGSKGPLVAAFVVLLLVLAGLLYPLLRTAGRDAKGGSTANPSNPTLARIPEPTWNAQSAVDGCVSNLKNMATAAEMFSTDHQGRYPGKLAELLPNYLKTLPHCPNSMRDYGYESAQRPDNYTLNCPGHNHDDAGIAEFYPEYLSTLGLQRQSPYLSTTPRNATEWVMKGKALASLNRYNEALEAYETARRFEPQWSWIDSNEADSRYELGQYDQAGRLIERAYKEYPSIDFLLLDVQMHNWAEKLESGRDLIKQKSATVKTDLERAQLLEAEVYDDAWKMEWDAGATVARSFPGEFNSYANWYLTVCLVGARKPDYASTAQSALEQFGARSRAGGELAAFVALSYLAQNQPDRAQEFLQKVIPTLRDGRIAAPALYLAGTVDDNEFLRRYSSLGEQTLAHLVIGMAARARGQNGNEHLKWAAEKGLLPSLSSCVARSLLKAR